MSAHERVWLARFVALIPPGGEILDLGCGDGEPMGRWLIGRGFRMTGVDTSPTLIARARQNLPQGNWIVGDMRDLELGRVFYGALAWFSLFHLTPDAQRAVMTNVARHLAPGSPFMFPSGDEAGEAIGEWCGEPLYHASMSPQGYVAAFADAGFSVAAVEPNPRVVGPGRVWLARRLG